MKNAVSALKIEYLWAIIVIAGIFIFVNTHPIRPNDFWFHIAYGRSLVQSGHIPTMEQHSFTQVGPYYGVYNYWFAQSLYYLIYKFGGAEWVVLVSSILVTITYLPLLKLGLAETKNWRAAALSVIFAASLGVTNWNIRPQLLAYPLLAGAVFAIYKFQENGKSLKWGFILSAIMFFWVNSHGTFFIPFLLVGCWGAEEAFRSIQKKSFSPLIRPLELFGFTLFGTLLNPRFFKVFDFIYNISTASSINRFVSEWQPTSIHTLEGQIFFVVLPVFFLVLMAARQKLSIAETLSLIFFTLLALKYTRAIIWFGITQATIFAKALHTLFAKSKTSKTPGRNSPLLNYAIAAMMLLAAVASLPWFKVYWPLSPEKKNVLAINTPIAAVNFMVQNNLPPNVFSEIGFSSYLIWAAPQEFKVFSDPRFEFYSEKIWDDYIEISYAEDDWENLLETYHVETLLLDQKEQQVLIEAAGKSDQWTPVYGDSIAAVFVQAK